MNLMNHSRIRSVFFASLCQGVPHTERDKSGCPTLAHLWSYFSELDPASGGRLSPDLKDLINRMFDVDPRQRLTIEEVSACVVCDWSGWM